MPDTELVDRFEQALLALDRLAAGNMLMAEGSGLPPLQRVEQGVVPCAGRKPSSVQLLCPRTSFQGRIMAPNANEKPGYEFLTRCLAAAKLEHNSRTDMHFRPGQRGNVPRAKAA